MKLKKIIYSGTSLLLIILIIVFSTLIIKSHNKSQITILGNPIENISYENVDETFTSTFMTSNFLVKMLENDASKQNGDKLIKLSSLIYNSKTIIINIGYLDLYNINDEELVNRQAEITINNIKKIVGLIIEKSKNANISLCLIQIPENSNFAHIYQRINNKIKQISIENGINIYNMSFFSSINIIFIEKYLKSGIIILERDKNGK